MPNLYDRSNCCGAPVNVSEGDEGTNCYICSRCDKPCDVSEKQDDWNTPKWFAPGDRIMVQ